MHQHTAALYYTAQRIADALGFGWTVIAPPEDELQRWVDLQRDDDRECGLRLSRQWNDETRYRIAGRYPSHEGNSGLRYQEAQAEITVSASRTPPQIARDILRRILPVYMEQYPRCQAAVATMREHKATTTETTERAHTLIRAYDLQVRGQKNAPRVYFDYAHGAEVNLKLYSVPRDKLARLLILLADDQD
jgi:hypothetical protein